MYFLHNIIDVQLVAGIFFGAKSNSEIKLYNFFAEKIILSAMKTAS